MRAIKPSAVCLMAMLVMTASGCGDDGASGKIRVGVVGAAEQMIEPVKHLDSEAGRIILGATAQGLVDYDNSGAVVPGLAQRWIVVDDGTSYIFRLRRARWPDGERVNAREVKQLLQKRVRAAIKNDPYGPFASISEILAMTADVIEIRLRTPDPNFLMALAAPELGIANAAGGSGPYRESLAKEGNNVFLLTPAVNPEDTDQRPPEKAKRMVIAERSAKAITRFQQRGADMMLGGTLADLPFVTLGELDRNSVRFDPVQGLFGLAMTSDAALFDDANVRAALSMAIEREAIIAYFEMNRWKIANQILPQQFDLLHLPTTPDWEKMSIEERRNRAAGVITRWRAQHEGKPIQLKIAMPDGPGMKLLFLALKIQFRAIGIEVEQVRNKGDLTLIDEVAPYDGAVWYLGRLSCARGVHCSEEAEELLKKSLTAASLTERADLIGRAEPLMQAHNGFIPLATPVRWSLVRPRLAEYSPSVRAYHDLRWLEK